MQNQMMPKINLLQMPDPAARTAKYVNMMNAAKQQEAAERQAAMAQETLDLKKKEDVREEALQAPRLNKAQQENILDALKIFREGVADIAEGDVAAAEAVRADLVARIPGWDKVIPPATTWDRNTRYRLMVEADKEFEKTFATPVASLEVGEDNTPKSVVVGNFPGAAGQSTVYDVPEAAAPPPPRATPTAPTAAPANPFAPGYTPNTAAAPPNSLSLVVDSALETGVMAKADFDKLVSIAQPGSGPKLQAWAKQNNIQIAPDAPGITDNQMRGAPADFQASPMSYDGQTPESQFAVYRGQPMQSQTAGLDSAPQMQNVMAQTQPRTFTKLQQRNPNVSPTPGIYGVPTGQVAATSQAQRASKQEVYDTELAKIRAARDAGPAPVTAQQKIARKSEVAQAYSKAQTLIDKAYNPKEGIISIANKIKMLSPDQKEAITGYSGYVPSFRESSREADTLFGNLKGVVTSLGKDAAAASGAVGNMAVQEWKIAADMIANLDLANMTPRALDAQMDRIIEQVRNATNLAERVYDIQYGDDVKQYPAFKLRGTPPAKARTPVAKGGSRISPDIDKILKSRGL
jgi:hypothetical protein